VSRSRPWSSGWSGLISFLLFVSALAAFCTFSIPFSVAFCIFNTFMSFLMTLRLFAALTDVFLFLCSRSPDFGLSSLAFVLSFSVFPSGHPTSVREEPDDYKHAIFFSFIFAFLFYRVLAGSLMLWGPPRIHLVYPLRFSTLPVCVIRSNTFMPRCHRWCRMLQVLSCSTQREAERVHLLISESKLRDPQVCSV
jgi:hypothetical protein